MKLSRYLFFLLYLSFLTLSLSTSKALFYSKYVQCKQILKMKKYVTLLNEYFMVMLSQLKRSKNNWCTKGIKIRRGLRHPKWLQQQGVAGFLQEAPSRPWHHIISAPICDCIYPLSGGGCDPLRGYNNQPRVAGISSRGPTETVDTKLYPPLYVAGPRRLGRERLRQKISLSG